MDHHYPRMQAFLEVDTGLVHQGISLNSRPPTLATRVAHVQLSTAGKSPEKAEIDGGKWESIENLQRQRSMGKRQTTTATSKWGTELNSRDDREDNSGEGAAH
ncbi:hypothetical protein V6N12_009777 [Hibiscus sabdariffa]|uniref:Uncharacterized protein n=1 Tax=Hibiscus sabdariffa TaxID=183260 RepID=A0ABR2ED83_9ROSI